jgi:hypothetical protein
MDCFRVASHRDQEAREKPTLFLPYSKVLDLSRISSFAPFSISYSISICKLQLGPTPHPLFLLAGRPRKRFLISQPPFLSRILADQYQPSHSRKTTTVAAPTPHMIPLGPWLRYTTFASATLKNGVPRKDETDARGTNNKLTSARACIEKLSC